MVQNRRGGRRRALPAWAIAVAAVGVAAILLTVVVVYLSPGPSGPSYPYVPGALGLGPGIVWESSNYFALDSSSQSIGASSIAALVNETGISQVSFGFAGESTNQSAGLRYLYNGVATSTSGSNDSSFISFCRSIHCSAVMGVPAEIDDPGAAAVTVRYVEQTLGFRPQYWEIGNEPVTWTHFGIPWTRWQATDASFATPATYAAMVARYIPAIRAVDPTARIIGIQADEGAPANAAWFQDLVSEDGSELSAVAYHSYPGGVGSVSNDSLTDFFATLERPSAFPLNYPATVSIVQSACASCHLKVLVGEYNAALVGNYSSFVTGYPDVPYIAAGLLTGLRENVTQVFFYALQANAENGLLAQDGTPNPVFYLYTTFLDHLTFPEILNSSIAGGPPGLYDLVSASASTRSVFVVDTNTVAGLLLNASSVFPSGTAVTESLWGPTLGQPEVRSAVTNASATWEIPPEGVLLLNGPGA